MSAAVLLFWWVFPFIFKNSSWGILTVFAFHQLHYNEPSVDLKIFFYLEFIAFESIICSFHQPLSLQILSLLFLPLFFYDYLYVKPSHCILYISYAIIYFPSELYSHHGQWFSFSNIWFITLNECHQCDIFFCCHYIFKCVGCVFQELKYIT